MCDLQIYIYITYFLYIIQGKLYNLKHIGDPQRHTIFLQRLTRIHVVKGFISLKGKIKPNIHFDEFF